MMVIARVSGQAAKPQRRASTPNTAQLTEAASSIRSPIQTWPTSWPLSMGNALSSRPSAISA